MNDDRNNNQQRIESNESSQVRENIKQKEREAEKIRNGWHECDNLVWKCQKHGFFYCKVLVPPTEKHCQTCLFQIKSQLKAEAWIKAKEKAQNWWKSLSLPEKQAQIKLLEAEIKNDTEYGTADIITWGNINEDKTETYRNGKFSTTNIEQVPNKLVEKFLNSSDDNEPTNGSQPINNNQQPNQSVLNRSSTTQITSQTGNFNGNTRFLGTPDNQNHNQQETRETKNRDFLFPEPKKPKSFTNDPHNQENILNTLYNSDSERKHKKISYFQPISILILFLFVGSIITFILWKKNKEVKS